MKTMFMLAALLASALLLTACPLTVRDRGPCRSCDEECDDRGCDDCREENCPDMAPTARSAHGANERRDCS